MSNTDNNNMSERQDPTIGGAGFEAEGIEASGSNTQEKQSFKTEKVNNFKTVFGSGVGRFSLVAVSIVIIIIFAVVYRQITKEQKKEVPATASVSAPTPPKKDTSAVEKVSESEAARRREVAAAEAQKAAAKGGSYEPGFDPEITADKTRNGGAPTGETSFKIDTQDDATATKVTPQTPGGYRNSNAAAATAAQRQNSNDAQQSQQERQRQAQLEAEYRQKIKQRDEEKAKIQKAVLEKAKALFGDAAQQNQNLNNLGNYSTAVYSTAKVSSQNQPTVNGNQINPVSAADEDSILSNGNKKTLIKTGNILFATLDSEMNTDHGNDVFATIRGGEWDGAKLIGKLEKTPDNVAIRFSVMSPQDNRPTMRISAVALREEDAAIGAADEINHHTLSRYTSLAVSSLLAGYGRAYERMPGTTVYTPGGVIQTVTNEPSDRQIAGMAVGEMGTQMSQEIRKNFNRPATYSTEAGKGFGVYFTADVTARNN